ncbi:MAG: hypothetical protein ACJARG_000057 [Arcticibacterium sp.]|jgi:hypothetical protein
MKTYIEVESPAGFGKDLINAVITRELKASKFLKKSVVKKMKASIFDLTEYSEVLYEVVSEFYKRQGSEVLEGVENEHGRGGMYELAIKLTHEFMEKYKDEQWDGTFHDELESFIEDQLT